MAIIPMTDTEYHGTFAASSSTLKTILNQTPAHFYAKYLDPDREQDEPTPAMKFGSAWHMALFEPEKYKLEYVTAPEGIDRRSKEGKALFAEYEAQGKKILTADDGASIDRMITAAMKHPIIGKTLAHKLGKAEQSFFQPSETLNKKARMDFIIPPTASHPGYIVDGKTCTDASREAFGKTCFDLGYLMQAAFYIDMFMAEFGTTEPPVFAWFAQEKTSPYCTAVYRATTAQIEFGRNQYEEALETLKECYLANSWPGYDTQISDLELPYWAQKIIDNDQQDIEDISYVD